MQPTDWKKIYTDTVPPLGIEEANDLVLVTRHAASLGAQALSRVNAEDYYHNNGAAHRELREAAMFGEAQ